MADFNQPAQSGEGGEQTHSMERRLYGRRPLEIPAAIQYRDGSESPLRPCLTRNMTVEGAYLRVRALPRLTGTLVKLYLGDPDDPLKLDALVLHQHAEGLGLLFMTIDDAQVERIRRLLLGAH